MGGLAFNTPPPRPPRGEGYTPVFALLAFGFMLALAGCGKKPGHVDAPDDVENDTYPRTYPDLSTDPKPEARPQTQPPAPPQPQTP
jgi:hypothetical protein